MFMIIFAALCVAVITAESSSVSSYSTDPSSSLRDYQYTGSSYLNGKRSYGDLSGATFSTTGSSPYSKSNSRYTADTSSDGTDSRVSLTSSFYKSKYGGEVVPNAIRPSSFHISSSSSSVTSSSPSSSSLSSSSELPSSQASGHYSNNPTLSSYYDTSSGPGVSVNEYTGSPGFPANFKERDLADHHHHHHGTYVTSGTEAPSAKQPEYMINRPSSYVYSGYVTGPGRGELSHSRPTTYSHSGVIPSALSSSGYMSGVPHQHNHQHHSSNGFSISDEFPSHIIQTQPSHSYKTYITSSNPSYSGKYQTVFGALKSLFGGGSIGLTNSDAASSATHVSSYPSGPIYSTGSMHVMAHHGSAPSAMNAAGPTYYLSSGSGALTSPFSKTYAPVRIVSGYGSGSNSGGKIIVVRESSGAHSHPSNSGSILGLPSNFPAKNKVSAFSPHGTGSTYISGSPSSLTYSPGSPSNAYSGSHSSGGSFPGGHSGSTFLGYSA